jgi:hypothetical protein
MTPDRSKIVATTMNWWEAIFIDLDTKTGEIKCVNPFTLSSVASYAFSSGNKYMYYSNADGFYRIPVEALGRISTGDEFESNSEFVGASGCSVGDVKFLTSGDFYFHNESNGGYIGVIKDCDAPHPVIDNKWLKLAKNANEHGASWGNALPKTYCYPYGFFAEEGCGGEVLLTFNDGDSESIHWDFGDGSETTATGQSVSHTYAANGRYTVRFTVNYSDSRQSQVYERSIDIKNIISKRPRIVAE